MPENNKTMDSKQQLQALFNLNIKTTAMFEFNWRIDQLCCASKHSGRGMAMLVSAVSETGATHMARAYCKRSNTRKKKDTGPVNLFVTVPFPPGVNNLADRILRKLGATKIPNSLYDKTVMCNELLRPDRFRSIVINDRGRGFEYDPKASEVALPWLFNLCWENSIPFVLIVNDRLMRKYFFKDLLSRTLIEHHCVKPFQWQSDYDNFISLMGRIDSKLPFETQSCLVKEKSARALFRATGGRMGRIMAIVNKAGLLAIEHKQPTITNGLLNVAIEMMTNPEYYEFLRENTNSERRKFIRPNRFPIHQLFGRDNFVKAPNKKVNATEVREPSIDNQME